LCPTLTHFMTDPLTLKYDRHEMICSTQSQGATWVTSPFCASSNNAHSSICIVLPERTESDFPSVWCTLAQGLRGGLSALVCCYTRIRWRDRTKLSTQIFWPWFHNSDNANCNSSGHDNYTSSNRDNCKMCVKGMTPDQPVAYKWMSENTTVRIWIRRVTDEIISGTNLAEVVIRMWVAC